MKYFWELVASAKSQAIALTDLTFLPAKNFSPYLELSFEALNDTTIPSVVEVNPYYRFLTVFQDYFDPNYPDDLAIRNELFNLIIHYLAEFDTYLGMTKREYELIFVIDEIERGCYGDLIGTGFNHFTPLEKKLVADNLLRLYTQGEGVYLFQDAINKLYDKATIYGNLTDKDLLILHLLVEETPVHRQKIHTLQALFLPHYYEVEIYWQRLFGIIGVDASMKQAEMVLY